MKSNVQLVVVSFAEEDISSIIGDIDNIQILSMTDSDNNLAVGMNNYSQTSLNHSHLLLLSAGFYSSRCARDRRDDEH